MDEVVELLMEVEEPTMDFQFGERDREFDDLSTLSELEVSILEGVSAGELVILQRPHPGLPAASMARQVNNSRTCIPGKSWSPMLLPENMVMEFLPSILQKNIFQSTLNSSFSLSAFSAKLSTYNPKWCPHIEGC